MRDEAPREAPATRRTAARGGSAADDEPAISVRDYQPYVAGPFRWRLGLRPLDPADWIEIGPDYVEEVTAKREILARVPSTVLCHLDDVEPEATEVLEMLVDHLTTQWPAWFSRVDGPAGAGSVVVNHRTGDELGLRGPLHPLDVAGRLVQEDMALLVERGGRLVFGGGCVCFPNRWDLPSKLGLSMAEVHAPVARLNDELHGPIESFFARLRPERSFWRLGWGVLDTDEPYQAVDGTAPPRPGLPDVADLPEGAEHIIGRTVFLRVERETIRRLPVTGAVLFTIRTYIRPLDHLTGRTDDAERLLAALEALPEDVAGYKQTAELTPLVRAWVRAGAA